MAQGNRFRRQALRDAGVPIALASDHNPGTSPGLSLLLMLSMGCTFFRLTPEEALRGVTVHAARALGLDAEIGSLEPGKKADIVLLDLFKPHLMPLNMPVFRITAFANAADVDTTIVDGRVLMRGRRVLSVDETEVLEQAQIACDRMLERSGLRHLTEDPPRLWRAAHY